MDSLFGLENRPSDKAVLDKLIDNSKAALLSDLKLLSAFMSSSDLEDLICDVCSNLYKSE